MVIEMIQCCGEDMLVSNGWYHCKKCYNRLVLVPEGKDIGLIASLIVDHVEGSGPSWKDLGYIFHELWKQGHYEGYEPDVPDSWNISRGD